MNNEESYKIIAYDHGGVANRVMREERRRFLEDAKKRAEELLNKPNLYRYIEIWKGSKTMWMCHKDNGTVEIHKREF